MKRINTKTYLKTICWNDNFKDTNVYFIINIHYLSHKFTIYFYQ
jgi:hypothetical protein